jgi:hypothetical protein
MEQRRGKSNIAVQKGLGKLRKIAIVVDAPYVSGTMPCDRFKGGILTMMESAT